MTEPGETDFAAILRALTAGRVDFIAVGAIAAISHGLILTTEDVDVVYSRARENLGRIVKVLAPFQPYLRGAPPGLPFQLDEHTLRNRLNFTLLTTLGGVDMLGEVAGGGTYEQLIPFAGPRSAFGIEFLGVNLDKLIQLKRAAGRPKDFEMIARLEAIRQERTASGRE